MPASKKPYIRFTYTKALEKRTLNILDAIDNDADPTLHSDTLSELIVDLMKTGMQFFFLDVVKKLKMGVVVTQTANMGVSSVQRVMAPVIRKIVGRMDKKQLHQVSRQIRDMMG